MMNPTHVCGVIEYNGPDGPVASDMCIDNAYLPEDEQRDFLHQCLDEWLNKSKGSGKFQIGGYID